MKSIEILKGCLNSAKHRIQNENEEIERANTWVYEAKLRKQEAELDVTHLEEAILTLSRGLNNEPKT